MAVKGVDPGVAGGTAAPRRGFGVLGALPRELSRELASAAEEAGYHTFWVNDEPDGDGLAALREAASVTATIGLGVGVIPLDRQGPRRIAARLAELELPAERLRLGIGSGIAAGGLDRVRTGVATLRESTAATLVVAAMGPRMCHLAGETADGVLLDWAAPSYVARARDIVAEGAAERGRKRPWLAGYVFTALSAESMESLHAEADHYAAIPSYATHFARMGVGPIHTAAYGEEPRALQEALARFDAVYDETVVRAVVAKETLNAYLTVLHAAAPI